MKKRFNMFMLRTGIDDLFQRAFPDDVPYPPVDAQDPDAAQRSYDDRTSFWPLKYRGELRKQVLQYARDRGLLHPEDVGTITTGIHIRPVHFIIASLISRLLKIKSPDTRVLHKQFGISNRRDPGMLTGN